MNIQDIINWLALHPNQIISYFLVFFAISLIGKLYINKNNINSPIKYLYSVLTYATFIPGSISVLLLLYNIFYLKKNLLSLNLVTYFLPITAMITILIIINKTVDTSDIPGFKKLQSLFTIFFITIVITYVLQRMFFGVFFVGKIQYLLVFFIFLFFGIKIAWNRLTK